MMNLYGVLPMILSKKPIQPGKNWFSFILSVSNKFFIRDTAMVKLYVKVCLELSFSDSGI